VTRQPTDQRPGDYRPTGQPSGPVGGSDDPTSNAGGQDRPGGCSCPEAGPVGQDLNGAEGLGGLAGWLRAAMTRLPATLGGARPQPLDVGRTSRVVTPAQRQALAVRDGGCVFPGCSRPLVWCEAHHVWHWLDGGPTDLANLVLLCRAHHRAVHEGGWHLARGPDGEVTATPPHRRPRAVA
jgi:HNH endonuclease